MKKQKKLKLSRVLVVAGDLANTQIVRDVLERRLPTVLVAMDLSSIDKALGDNPKVDLVVLAGGQPGDIYRVIDQLKHLQVRRPNIFVVTDRPQEFHEYIRAIIEGQRLFFFDSSSQPRIAEGCLSVKQLLAKVREILES